MKDNEKTSEKATAEETARANEAASTRVIALHLLRVGQTIPFSYLPEDINGNPVKLHEAPKFEIKDPDVVLMTVSDDGHGGTLRALKPGVSTGLSASVRAAIYDPIVSKIPLNEPLDVKKARLAADPKLQEFGETIELHVVDPNDPPPPGFVIPPHNTFFRFGNVS